jgi:acyl-CoA thioesterase FadM
MTMLLRLLRILLTARWRKSLDPLEESVLSFRVMPADLDVNLHLNNGRYLALMDLGRLDAVLRSGVFRQMLKRRWTPLVGSETIRFRRSLAPFRKYQLRTRLVGWDEKWFFFQQRFVVGAELQALAMVKGLLRGRSGNVAPAEVLASSGHAIPSPPLAAGLVAWCEADAAMFDAAFEPRT